jgi:HlyD family secretion protein
MNRNYFVLLAGIALLCLLLIFVSLWQEIDSPVTKQPVTRPNTGPYKTQIAGVGVTEPSSGNILIGTPLNRIITEIYVKVGEKISKGETLFTLENRELFANLNIEEAAYDNALAKQQRLKSLPQPEDLAIAEANLNSAKIALESAKSQNEMVQQLTDPRAVSQEEKNRRLFAMRQAEVKLNQAQANYDKVKAGAWKPDLEIADAEISLAKAKLDLAGAEIERTIIKSPIDGTVLQVRIHEGELPTMDPFRTPMMIVGNTDEMYVRVSINQVDIPYFHPESAATAYFQGDQRVKFSLNFVRMEPYLVSKQYLTNEINEKVDTRVLQIIYRIKNEGKPIFVGQQMDVFIETQRANKNE